MAGKRKRIPAIIREHYRRIGRKGGKARAEKLTKQELQRIARLGAEETNRRRALQKTA